MTKKLNKTVWPFLFIMKHKLDDDGWATDDDDLKIREEWLFKTFNDNIRNRVYIVEDDAGISYYFKDEQDYNWFIWRWV